MKKMFGNLLIAILSVFSVIGININTLADVEILDSFTGITFVHIILAAAIYYMLKKVTQLKDRRSKVVCGILAMLFAAFEVVGNSIDTYLSLGGILTNDRTVVKSLIKFLGYGILLFGTITFIFDKCNKFEIKDKIVKWFTTNKRSFFICWAIIFISFVPYFLNYFPGNASVDSISQILQGLGARQLENHHPVFHTMIIGICMNIGEAFGNYNIGIALYSVFQMTIMSAIFSFCIYYMAKRRVDIRIRILTLLFFVLYPVHGMYSIVMWKDVLFTGFVTIFVICMSELVLSQENFLKSKKKNILFLIVMLLVVLQKNNGLYIILLALPFIFIIARKNWKRLIIIFMILFGIIAIIKGPIYSALNIKEGGSEESLSIPLQQIARIKRDYGDELTKEQHELIYEYLPVDNLEELYYEKISDNVKINFNEEKWEEDKVSFIKLWLELVLKHPISAIEAFLCNNYGYWYPETEHFVVERVIIDKDIAISRVETDPETQIEIETESKLELEQTPITDNNILKSYESIIDKKQIPVIGMLFSIGLFFWIMCICIGYNVYKKDYKKILIYIPIMILWLTCMASPVYGEFRYAYGLFTTMPLLIGVNFIKSEKKKEDIEEL